MDIYDFIKEIYPLLLKIKEESIVISSSDTNQSHSILIMRRAYEYHKEKTLTSSMAVWWTAEHSYRIVYEYSYIHKRIRFNFKIRIYFDYIIIFTEQPNLTENKNISLTDFENLITNKEMFVLSHGRINIPFIDIFDEYKHEMLKDIKMIAKRNDND